MQQVDGLFPENYAGTNFAEDFDLNSDEQEMLGVSSPSPSPSPSQLSPDALFLLEVLQQGELDVNKYLGGR